jgi:hypothetical protein
LIRSRSDVILAIVYVAAIAGVAAGMFVLRQRALASYGSPDAATEWQEWKQGATEMSEQPGPVRRRPPKSDEPPALILMRDHFGACLAGSVGLTAILLGAIVLMFRGAIIQPQPFVDRSQPEPPRGRTPT